MPNFVVIGAMKAGTTALYSYLSHHPKIFMPIKEPDFFSYHWTWGLDWYASLYADADGDSLIGEASPSYTMFTSDAAPRMAEILPGAKLIYCVRHPIERIRAQYLHAVATGKEDRSIERAVREVSYYLDSSRYASWADRYLRYFDRDRLLFIIAEELRDQRRVTFASVLRHLGLADDWIPANIDEMIHRTEDKRRPRALAGLLKRISGRPPSPAPVSRLGRLYRRVATAEIDPSAAILSERTTRWLEGELTDEIRRLRDLIGPSFEGWGLL